MKGVSLVSISTFAALAAAHPQGLWWGTDTCYPSPENTDNQCLESQKTGFDWSELANGDNWTFEGFRFTGFSPKNACNSSGGKCIMGKLNRDDGYTLQMDAVDAPFSVRKFHLSTSRKTDVLITYELADGSSCRQIAFSTPEGHDVSNDQCGGAVSVKFMLPEESKFGECDFNIHEINFDCSGGPKSPPQPNPSSSVATIPPHLATHSSTILEIPSTPVLHTPPPTSEIQQVTPTVEGPPHSEVHESTFTVWTTSTITVTKCPPSATSCPAHSNGIVTSTLVGSTTVYPSGPHEVTTTAQPISTVTPALPSSPVVPPPQCPKLVPKCINTWLSIPKCDSNGDAACFCPSSEFTGKVQSCIHAWGTSEKEKESALSYFAGICAPYVPKNPAIIDLVPSGTSSNGPPAQTRVVPFTTLPVSVQTTTIPPTPEVPLTTITWSSHTVSCPRVGFSTFTSGSTTTVGLVVPTPESSAGTSSTSCSSSQTTSSTPCPSPTSQSTSFTTATMTTTCKTPGSSSTQSGHTSTETFPHSNAAAKTITGLPWVIGIVSLLILLS